MSFQDDMDTVFLGADNPFAETISYTPTAGTITDIVAQVVRGAPESVDRPKADKSHHYKIEITVSKTDIPTVKINSDIVSLLQHGTLKTYHVAGVLYEDSVSYRLGLV